MTLDPDFELGELVYLRVGDEDARGIVTGIVLRPHGCTFYVSWGNRTETEHYACELSREPRYAGVPGDN